MAKTESGTGESGKNPPSKKGGKSSGAAQAGKAKAVKFKAALDRPDLTEEMVQRIVVDATPDPHDPEGSDDPLKDFGVIDDTEARVHRGKIQGAMGQIGYQIKRADIDSGPTVTVGESTISVLDNAH